MFNYRTAFDLSIIAFVINLNLIVEEFGGFSIECNLKYHLDHTSVCGIP